MYYWHYAVACFIIYNDTLIYIVICIMLLYYYIINERISKYILIRQGAVHLWRTPFSPGCPCRGGASVRAAGPCGREAVGWCVPPRRSPARSGGAPEGGGGVVCREGLRGFYGAFTAHAAHPPVKVATPCRGPLWERQAHAIRRIVKCAFWLWRAWHSANA